MSSATLIRRLEWDSQHFGILVAHLEGSAVSDLRLMEQLDQARHTGIHLVYYFDTERKSPSADTLEHFSGRLTDDRVTYESLIDGGVANAPSRSVGDVQIKEYPFSAATPDLIELGIAAGELSRFRVDPRIPPGTFELLYQEWVERSVRHEIADIVLIAETDEGQLLGFVTAARNEAVGVVGLIAVAPTARGRGIGRRLLMEGHRWMAAGGVERSVIVTQANNSAACRLYESCGYQRIKHEHVYHFWLQSDAE